MLDKDVAIIIAEDDPGHAALIQKNIRRAGLANEFIILSDGQQTLDFLYRRGAGIQRKPGAAYLLLLDIRMPKVDGIEVLRQIKKDEELRKLPVIMITTTDDPHDVEICHRLGCSSYITKPVAYDKFVEAIQQLGMYLKVMEAPKIDG